METEKKKTDFRNENGKIDFEKTDDQPKQKAFI